MGEIATAACNEKPSDHARPGSVPRAIDDGRGKMFGFAGVALADGPADETPRKREHEILRERPSGFWTSNKPAQHGAYRWRLLGVGIGLIGITGFVMIRMVKKANREREKRARESSEVG